MSKFCKNCVYKRYKNDDTKMIQKNSVELIVYPYCAFKYPKESEKCPSCEHKFKLFNRHDKQGELIFIFD